MDVLCADLVTIDEVQFTLLDDAGAQLLFRFAAAYERRARPRLALALRPVGTLRPSTPPPSACRTGSAPQHHLHIGDALGSVGPQRS